MTTVAVSKEQLVETIIGILQNIAPEADYDGLDPKANLQEALDIDSFDFLNLLIGVDEALGVSVPEADYGQVRTMDDLVSYIAARLN
jgi:acyl carrier protein